MALPTSLIPTLDALLSSGARWLPMGASKNYRPGVRYLRAAHQAWFDLVVILDGKPSLDWLGEAQVLCERDPALFSPSLDHGLFEPIPLHGELLERARFVDGQFASLWAGLERGTIDAQCHTFEPKAALRGFDGRYWNVAEDLGQLVSAELREPWFLAWQLRARLWEGTVPRTRPLSPGVQARVAEAVSVETILRAPHVEVSLQSPTFTSGLYRLSGREAFHFTETGEELPSVDYTSPYPETVYDFLPCSRADVEQALRSSSTVVRGVDYGR